MTGLPGELVAADSLMTRVIRQRYLPIQEVVQLPPPDVMHLMFVIVGTLTKGAIVVLEPYGSLCTGMVHGVGGVVVISAGQVAASVALRYRRFRAQLEADARRRTDRNYRIAEFLGSLTPTATPLEMASSSGRP
jgi:hypothetical protein